MVYLLATWWVPETGCLMGWALVELRVATMAAKRARQKVEMTADN